MTNYGRLTAGLIAVWFVFSLAASALHLFSANPGAPPRPLLLAVGIPIALFVLWYRTSSSFRDFVLSLNPSTLTIVQAWRTAGFAFLVLYTYHILPGLLALPAGWGDMFIGVTAVPVALKLANAEYRKSFIVWQLLGMTDLVTALSTGAVAQFVEPHGVSTAPMTVLPMSLIPTFAVPLLMILHIISIAQAARWPEKVGAVGTSRSLAVSTL